MLSFTGLLLSFSSTTDIKILIDDSYLETDVEVDYADSMVYIKTELTTNDTEINSNNNSNNNLKDYTYYVNEVFDEITSRTRESGTTGETQTLNYLISELNSFGYDTKLQPFDIYETTLSAFFNDFWLLNPLGYSEPLTTSNNLIATKNYDENKKTIVFSAHYDATENSIGAIDNATGVVVLLESARLIAEYTENLDYNIEIIFFGSEEYSLTGSRSYILSLSEEKFNNIIGNFNIDMTSTSKWRKLLLDGCSPTSFYDEFMRINPDFEVMELGLSDEASFSRKEIPSFRFTTVNMLDHNFDPSVLGKETENTYVDYELLKIDANIVFGFMKDLVIDNIL